MLIFFKVLLLLETYVVGCTGYHLFFKNNSEMAAIKFAQQTLSTVLKRKNVIPAVSLFQARYNSQYFPINDKVFGLTEEQQQVR
jgi:uncharacterized protein (UPF0333 family)